MYTASTTTTELLAKGQIKTKHKFNQIRYLPKMDQLGTFYHTKLKSTSTIAIAAFGSVCSALPHTST
jgi:hypothetical protein